MEIYNKYIDKTFMVSISYVKTKKFRISVLPDLSINVAAPKGSGQNDIKKVLDEAEVWVAKRAIKYENSVLLGLEKPVENGDKIYILGENKEIAVHIGEPCVIVSGDRIVITVKKEEQAEKLFDKWWREQSHRVFSAIFIEKFEIFKKMGCAIPDMRIKKMHTRWGSCNKRLCRINLNYYLYSLPALCIEYVIMHELVHLIYSNHKKEFYDFLSACMPDWKDRKKLMDEKFLLCRQN